MAHAVARAVRSVASLTILSCFCSPFQFSPPSLLFFPFLSTIFLIATFISLSLSIALCALYTFYRSFPSLSSLCTFYPFFPSLYFALSLSLSLGIVPKKDSVPEGEQVTIRQRMRFTLQTWRVSRGLRDSTAPGSLYNFDALPSRFQKSQILHICHFY